MTTLAAGPELDAMVERLCEPERYAKSERLRAECVERGQGILPSLCVSPVSASPGLAFMLLIRVCKARGWGHATRTVERMYIVEITVPSETFGFSDIISRSSVEIGSAHAEATAICLALVEACQKTGGAPSEPA